tara:strand:- start:381 stop:608 length:228 start_codon:yes stop_codon:yes gene_type:complete
VPLPVPPPNRPRAFASAFGFALLGASSRARSARSSRASVLAAFSCAVRAARSRSTRLRAYVENKTDVAGQCGPSD